MCSRCASRHIAVALLILLGGSLRAAEAPDALNTVANQIARQISPQPQVSADMFAPPFLKAASVEKIAAIYKSLHEKYGPVLHVVPLRGATASSGKFTFACKAVEFPVSLAIEPAAPHRIAELWFGPPTPRLQSLEDATAQLAKLPGRVSYELLRLDDDKVIESLHADTPLAIGSTFKLYVLAALVKQQVAWDKVVKLDARYKSLPSGEMQTWPDGSPVSVHTLALKMISTSDNTAADTLLHLVGREQVEKLLPELGLKNPQANIPFLSTRELFQLKSDAALRKEYLAADVTRRITLLKELADKPLPNTSAMQWSEPIAIDRLEWFASAADLCRLMAWFDKQHDSAALDILALNPGVHPAADRFQYIGYKGGSENGVLNMTWLLHSTSGHRYALSATWNDPDHDVDLERFSGLLLAVMDLLESPA